MEETKIRKESNSFPFTDQPHCMQAIHSDKWIYLSKNISFRSDRWQDDDPTVSNWLSWNAGCNSQREGAQPYVNHQHLFLGSTDAPKTHRWRVYSCISTPIRHLRLQEKVKLTFYRPRWVNMSPGRDQVMRGPRVHIRRHWTGYYLRMKLQRTRWFDD